MEGKPRLRDLLEVAGRLQTEVDSAGMGLTSVGMDVSPRTWLQRFDEMVTFEPLRDASRILFANGHYALAVEEAFKCLNNIVKAKSGLNDLDGDALMRRAFSGDKPILKVNSWKTRSEKDEQRGYMELYAGAMTGIRNPRAHEHGLEDRPEHALEMLTIAGHLMRKAVSSTRSRIRKGQTPTRKG